MLPSLLTVLLLGFIGGEVARRSRLPPLVGMVVAGILMGPAVGDWLAPDLLAGAGAFRTVAVMVILIKAGLGLDREKLAQQGSVAVRLGLLPAVCEAIAVAIAAHWIFQLDWGTGLLLGCVLGAESPAVIVPGMLRLKSLGWGVAKGIPDAILTGSALSDVLLLLGFNLLLTRLGSAGVAPTMPLHPALLLPLQVLGQIGLGVLVGWGMARVLVALLVRYRCTQTAVQDMVVAAGLGLGIVVVAEGLPLFSGYLAVMALGFFLVELDPPLGRRLRQGFDVLWAVAQIFLFVLLGASLQPALLGAILLPGLGLLAIGTLGGRAVGWALSTWGSDWTGRERLFLLPGNSAKATVQAAIGGIPLAQGLPHGDTILALSILSILVTAPLGAWAIPTFAPRLLQRGTVDPTKVTVTQAVTLLAAVDTSPLASVVLAQAAAMARRSDGTVVVLHVLQGEDPATLAALQDLTRRTLADIRHQFLTLPGPIPAAILATAEAYAATEIIVGKRGHRAAEAVLMGSVSQQLLETSPFPVLVLEA